MHEDKAVEVLKADLTGKKPPTAQQYRWM